MCVADSSRRSRLAARMAISALASAMPALFVVRGLADVVQQQREVKQAGPFEALKQRRVMFVRRLLGFPDFVELFEADQRVFVGGVLMVKLVLHQARQFAEFGNVFAEQIHLVHRAQNRRDFAAPFEDGQERFAHVLVVQKVAVHQRKLVADQLRQVGMQLSSRRCWACRKTRISRRGESRKMRLDAAWISPSMNIKPSTGSGVRAGAAATAAQRKPALARRDAAPCAAPACA